MDISENDETVVINHFKKYDYILRNVVSKMISIHENDNRIIRLDNIITFDSNEQQNFPCVLLLGGKTYEFYYELFKPFTILKNYNTFSIESVDYDISVLVTNDFTLDIGINIIKRYFTDNTYIFNEFNKKNGFEIITKSDISQDLFLKTKKIINKDFSNVLLTVSKKGKIYCGIHFSVKFGGKLYQIIEIMYWYGNTINQNLNFTHLQNTPSILYDLNGETIILPHPKLLIDTNGLSIISRFENSCFNKCSKDFLRLLFLYNLHKNLKITDNLFVNTLIYEIHDIFKMKYPHIFNMCYNICNINEPEKTLEIFKKTYLKFLKLDIEKQLKILSHMPDLDDDEKNMYSILNNGNVSDFKTIV